MLTKQAAPERTGEGGAGNGATASGASGASGARVMRRSERVVGALLPSFGDMLFICVLLGVTLGLQGKALGYDGDAAWNIRIGVHILREGLPRTEFLLSTTYGKHIIYWEWGSQVLYGLAYWFGGLNGVVALAGTLAAGVGAGLYQALRRRGLPLLLALALALMGTALTSITWTARDQLFSLALTLWWSEWLWSYWRDGKRWRLVALPPVMALWANLHGGFIGGMVLLGVALGVVWLAPGGRGKAEPVALTVAAAGVALASLVTPWGVGLYQHILGFFHDPLINDGTQEFQSPNFHQLIGQTLLALVFALVAAWGYALWRRGHLPSGVSAAQRDGLAPEPLALALAGTWTALAMTSVRYIPLWGLIVAPILGDALVRCARAQRLGAALSREGDVRDGGGEPAGGGARGWAAWVERAVEAARRRALGLGGALVARGERLSRRLEVTDALVGRGVWLMCALIFVVALVGNGGVVPGTRSHIMNAQFDGGVFPAQAAQLLHRRGLPEGRGFTTYQWGGYLDYALPEYHAFIDSRSDVYGEPLLGDYAAIIGLAPNWRELWARYAIRWALLPAHEPLTQVLALTAGWSCAPMGADGVAALCVADGAG